MDPHRFDREGCVRAGRRLELDRRELELFGKMLDRRFAMLGGRTAAEFLAESLLKVRGKDGRAYALKGNAAQREFERRRGAANIVLKARQMGMTTWVAGRFFLKTVTRPGTLTLQVAHTQASAQEMLRIVHRFVEYLPRGLRGGVLRTSKRNVREIVFPEIDSEYRVVSAADCNAGRGMTFQNLHCSEVSRWQGNAKEVLAGLRAGLAPDGELVLESTPNGAGGCFYEQWQEAEATGMVRHFFPWWMEAGYRGLAVEEASLTEEELELVTRPGLELTLEQIGFRRELRTRMPGMMRQEFVEDAESCFRVSGESYFELAAVEDRLKIAPKPIERRFNGMMQIWYPSLIAKEYVIAVDPAGGGADGDWSAVQVLDRETGLQCAEYAGHVSGLELARLVANLGWEYNKCPVVVERNNHGSGVLWLMEHQVGYPKVYKAADGQAGFLMTSVSRPQVLARMAAAMVEAPGLFQSKRLLAECRTFVRLGNGGVGARSGTHDDRVMAMAIALAAREEMSGKRV